MVSYEGSTPSTDVEVSHWDDIPWWRATPHRFWQRHRAQTMGRVKGKYIERCSCGAFGPAPWVQVDKPRRRR